MIEVITVIAIIMVLAAMTVGGLNYAQKKAEISRTEVFMQSLGAGLEQYRADNGFFPQGDGLSDSSEQVYIALYGDGELEFDSGSQQVRVRSGYEPDGEPDEGSTVYVDTLTSPLPYTAKKARTKEYNVRKNGSTYVIVDAWMDPDDNSQRQEIFYRHDPSGADVDMMNPPSDFDLWSLGPDGKGGPGNDTKKERADDIVNWK